MAGGDSPVRQRAVRLVLSLAGVIVITLAARTLVPVNATTAGFGYLLLILVLASVWGFIEALVASVAATLAFNFFFFPPLGTFTIEDPQNWVALFSFLATSLIASRLSAIAKRRALDAVARQQDLERLYTFSRGILLIHNTEPFPKQLVHKLAEIFELTAAVLYERRTGESYRAGPAEFEGLDEQIREAALHGTSFSDPAGRRQITAVQLGSEPIASLALQGRQMPDSVIRGIANLVAIGRDACRRKCAELRLGEDLRIRDLSIGDATRDEDDWPGPTRRGDAESLAQHLRHLRRHGNLGDPFRLGAVAV